MLPRPRCCWRGVGSDQAATSMLACTSSRQRAQGAALAAEGGEHTGQSHPVTRTTRGFAHSIRAPEPTFRDLSRPLSRPAASAAHRHRYRRLPGSRWAGTAVAGKPTVSGPHPCRGQPTNAPRLDPGSIPEGPPAAALRRAAARSLRPPYLGAERPPESAPGENRQRRVRRPAPDRPRRLRFTQAQRRHAQAS